MATTINEVLVIITMGIAVAWLLFPKKKETSKIMCDMITLAFIAFVPLNIVLERSIPYIVSPILLAALFVYINHFYKEKNKK